MIIYKGKGKEIGMNLWNTIVVIALLDVVAFFMKMAVSFLQTFDVNLK